MSKGSSSTLFGRREALLLMAVLAAAFIAIGIQVRAAHADGTFVFDVATSTVEEGDVVCILVERSPSANLVQVIIERTGGDAPAGDIDGGFGVGSDITMDFGPGVSQRNIPINDSGPCIQTNDTAGDQGSRTVVFEITGFASGTGTVGAQNTHTLTITDNDADAEYSYQSTAVNVVEGTQNFAVTVVREGSTDGTASVNCTATGGSAASPEDFTIDDGTANFVDGASTATCTFDIDDAAGGETIVLGFASPVNFPGGSGTNTSMTITITDTPPGTIQFTTSSYNVNENAGTANVAVSRTGGTSGAASVTCSTVAGGSATAGVDYTTQADVLNWNNGEGGTKNCTIPIANDNDAENNETIALVLSGVSGASLGAQDDATLTIIDDDGEGILQFTSANFSGTESGGPITITVSRTGGTDGAVTVQYSTSNGTATSGSDYSTAQGTLTWNNGEGGNKSFTVTPLPDAVNEGSETVNLQLSNPTGGATLGAQDDAVLTITDSTIIPTITNITPGAGPLAGLAGVVITGTNFTGTTSVTFGGTPATNVVVNNSTQITLTAPAHAAGTVEVVVTTPAGSNTTTGSANDFTYTSGPTVTSISPNTGPAAGATVVTITGTNFVSSGLVVKFGTVTATANYINATTVVAVAPSQSAGVVDVIVQTPGGTSPNTAADDFTYTGVALPVVTLLTPSSGPIGTSVVITGTGFTGATAVTFGGTSASFTVNSPTQITATVPVGTAPGSVDVRVTGPGGTSANTANDNFNNTSQAANTTYTLFFRFTLIVWTGADNKPIATALAGGTAGTNNVSALIGAIWLFNPQTQAWGGYFPGSENIPGANNFTTFRTGTAYFIALKSASGAPVTWIAPSN